EPRADCVVFQYQHGLLHYRSVVTARGKSRWTVTGNRIATRIDLQSQQSIELELRIDGSETDGAALADDGRERDQCLQDWRDGFAQFVSPSNRMVEQIVASNVRDFASFPLLDGRPDEWLALQAGIPL